MTLDGLLHLGPHDAGEFVEQLVRVVAVVDAVDLAVQQFARAVDETDGEFRPTDVNGKREIHRVSHCRNIIDTRHRYET